MTPRPPQRAWLSAVAAEIKQFAWTPRGMKLVITAHADGFIHFGGATGCKLLSGGKGMAARQASGLLKAAFGAGQYEMELVCK